MAYLNMWMLEHELVCCQCPTLAILFQVHMLCVQYKDICLEFLMFLMLFFNRVLMLSPDTRHISLQSLTKLALLTFTSEGSLKIALTKIWSSFVRGMGMSGREGGREVVSLNVLLIHTVSLSKSPSLPILC